MNKHLDELLAGAALGILDDAEAAELDALLAGDEALVAALADAERDASLLALTLAPVPLPEGGLARLLEATHTVGRFDAMLERLAGLLDLGLERVRELVRSMDEPASWEGGPVPGTWLIHLQGGPRLGAELVGFVKVEAGLHFPHHKHLGDEVVVVLQGGLRDSRGVELRAGEVCEMDDGTEHDFVAMEGPDLIYLVLLGQGVEFPGLGSY